MTKARIVLEMTVNGAPMGSEIPSSEPADIRVDAWAPGKIRKTERVKNTRLLREIAGSGDKCHIQIEDKTGGNAFYHCRITLDDGNLAVCSPVWIG